MTRPERSFRAMAAERNQSRSGTERERKFLVEQLPPGLAKHKHELLEQGYLATSQGSADGEAEVRLRRAGERHVLTVKKGHGQARLEKEVPLPSASARMLWPLTRGHRVKKVRYTIPYGGLKIELDVYRGKARGLATAEVEFPSAAALRRFTPPPWFGREVTGVKALSNSELARRGWTKKRARK
jgi:adenylate cyclase